MSLLTPCDAFPWIPQVPAVLIYEFVGRLAKPYAPGYVKVTLLKQRSKCCLIVFTWSSVKLVGFDISKNP